ncbi:MAG TPA: IS1182 family transposase [bacterium]|nr:IS1182 family transposase [bacterium]
MVGNQDRWHEDIFVACPLRDLVPDDHILKQVDRVLDLSWLRDEVSDSYCSNNGRPSIDPEAALRLMLAGYLEGIVHDRVLMRQVQVNIAIRWFAGYRLHEVLPDHSSLTKLRQRWGEERFWRIFKRTVGECVRAGLVDGKTVHVDATLIRADVSWESLVAEHVEQVIAENEGVESSGETESKPRRRPGRPRTRPEQRKKRSKTDPEATMATSSHRRRMEPCFKDHIVVDDKAGVILDVKVTTGEASECKELMSQLDRVEAQTGEKVEVVTADAGYGRSENYAALEERRVQAAVVPQREARTATKLPLRRFKYDAKHQLVRCPAGKILHRQGEAPTARGWIYRARACDCRACPLKGRCVPRTASVRTVLIVDGYEALLRARRARSRGWDEEKRESYRRHQWWVEGRHGEAKVQHGLARAVRRGRWNVAIQAYLTAAVINLKRLAAALAGNPPSRLVFSALTRLVGSFCRRLGLDLAAVRTAVA